MVFAAILFILLLGAILLRFLESVRAQYIGQTVGALAVVIRGGLWNLLEQNVQPHRLWSILLGFNDVNCTGDNG